MIIDPQPTEHRSPKNIEAKVFYQDEDNEEPSLSDTYAPSTVVYKNKEQYKIHLQQYQNQRKQFIAAIVMAVIQIVTIFLYFYYIRPESESELFWTWPYAFSQWYNWQNWQYRQYSYRWSYQFISYYSYYGDWLYQKQVHPLHFFKPLALSFASTLGLGLLFTYNRRLILSGLGFSLFINAYCLQYYPLMSALWEKAGLYNLSSSTSVRHHRFYLSSISNSIRNSYLSTDMNFPVSSFNSNFNHIQGCFRAAMAINVAVSCVLGRVGLLQILMTILIGTFGYELNRKVCSKFGDDAFGTMYIFAFGGWMGLAMSAILRLKEKTNLQSINKLLKPSQVSSTLSLLGAAILMLTFPFLTFVHSKFLFDNHFQLYTPVFCMILSSSGGLLGSISISLIKGLTPQVKDFIHGPIAGMIIGGASSYFTANISYCIGMGLIGGTLQALIQHYAEKKIVRNRKIFSTISFSLFGLQGFLGCFAAALGKGIMDANPSGLHYNQNLNNFIPQKLMAYGVISSAMGIGFGIVLGLIFYKMHINSSEGYLNDKRSWIVGQEVDGQYERIQKPVLQETPNPSQMCPTNKEIISQGPAVQMPF